MPVGQLFLADIVTVFAGIAIITICMMFVLVNHCAAVKTFFPMVIGIVFITAGIVGNVVSLQAGIAAAVTDGGIGAGCIVAFHIALFTALFAHCPVALCILLHAAFGPIVIVADIGRYTGSAAFGTLGDRKSVV